MILGLAIRRKRRRREGVGVGGAGTRINAAGAKRSGAGLAVRAGPPCTRAPAARERVRARGAPAYAPGTEQGSAQLAEQRNSGAAAAAVRTEQRLVFADGHVQMPGLLQASDSDR